jgi:hypothetical protein
MVLWQAAAGRPSMAVKTCRQCHRPYWRYTRALWPTGGVCSQLCHDLRIDARQARRESHAAPGIPRAILELQRSHRRIVHHVNDSTAWFEACAECERLEEKYAAAIAYHLPAPVAPDSVAVEPQKRSSGHERRFWAEGAVLWRCPMVPPRVLR